MNKKNTPPKITEAPVGTLCDMFSFGDTPDNEEIMLKTVYEIIELINNKQLSALCVNTILLTLGSLAQEMVNTPEKELKVCLGIDS